MFIIWDTIKFILNMNKNKSNFPLFFLVDGKKDFSKKEIAEHFKEFFSNLCERAKQIQKAQIVGTCINIFLSDGIPFHISL